MLNQGFNNFDSSLIEYLNSNGYNTQNYMVSPTSFRAALALAVVGSEGETQEKLLNAMGFESLDEVYVWYDKVLTAINTFADDLEADKKEYASNKWYDGDEPDGAFSIANSVWNNTDEAGNFKNEYINLIANNFKAIASEVSGDEITDKINQWVNKETNGMIKEIGQDLSDNTSVLVNAVYLRTAWMDKFDEGFTKKGEFHTAAGNTLTKDFMSNESRYSYYNDNNTQLVILPMNGNIKAAFVIGNNSNILDKIDKATQEEVLVTIPKFELETSINGLTGYLEAHGAEIAMSPEANFSAMSDDSDWYINNILQKSKVKLDEDGIEAAAVTAIMIKTTGFFEKPEPKVFTADVPFSFYIYSDVNDSLELLFYGQYLE